MRVAKYACPQCGCEGECPEEKVFDDDVCTACGFVFMPCKCAGLEVVDSAESMPPLPVAPPPRQPPVRKTQAKRRVSAAIAADPKRKRKKEKKEKPGKQGDGCFTFLMIILLLLVPFQPGVLLAMIVIILLRMNSRK